LNVVAIGASAGGIEALEHLFRALPQEPDAAFFVVVHVPAHTPSRLHELLPAWTAMPVSPATDGERIRAGRVYVALADRHLMLHDGHVRLTRGPKECRNRPSIDVLLRSAAVAYGPKVIGVILSGMLDDGTAGLWSVKDHAGTALVQEPSDARYASMPESARLHVEVDFTGTAEALGREIGRRLALGTPEAQPAAGSQRHELENLIANQGNALQSGVMKLGRVSKYTCPDCHGVLVQIEEGSIVRFRCHTGHAFSIKTLLAEVNDAIDAGLWDAIRAVEERVLLLRQMADLARHDRDIADADSCERQAADAEHHIRKLRDLVLDPRFFGHDEKG
jgi:two-component system, chemotaxis family, protein-glutamate methylesterase/glutaminase